MSSRQIRRNTGIPTITRLCSVRRVVRGALIQTSQPASAVYVSPANSPPRVQPTAPSVHPANSRPAPSPHTSSASAVKTVRRENTVPPPAGHHPTTCVNCGVGKYSTGENTARCLFCEEGKYANLPGSSKCNPCDAGTYTNQTGTIVCEDCPDASTENAAATKCLCDPGTYEVLSAKNNEHECERCPSHVICKKDSRIENWKVARGYWRNDATAKNIYACRVAYGCLGGIINNHSDNLCNVGHRGPLCDVCLDGWAKNDGKCFECLPGGKSMSYFITALFPLIAIGVLVFMIKTANPTTDQKEPLSGVIKIFMNYAQIFSLASAFEINWPGDVRQLFRAAKDFSSPA